MKKTLQTLFLALILPAACSSNVESPKYEIPTDGLDQAETNSKDQTLVGILGCRSEDSTTTVTDRPTIYSLTAKEKVYKLALEGTIDIRICGLKVAAVGQLDSSNKLSTTPGKIYPLEAIPVPVVYKSQYKVLFILFQDADDPYEPVPPAEVKNWMFEHERSFANYFKEATFNGIQITGTVAPSTGRWYSLRGLNTAQDCNHNLWDQPAREAAIADGYRLEDYDRIVFVLGKYIQSCGWNGVANFGSGLIHMNGWHPTVPTLNTKVATHEMGHTLGLGHADGLRCSSPQGTALPWDDGSVADVTCDLIPYGDRFDTMGADWAPGRYPRHFSAIFKERIAQHGTWFPAARTMTVPRPGRSIIRLSASELSSGGTQLVKIVGGSGSSETLFLESRTSFGFDNFGVNDPVARGLLIRQPDIAFYAQPRTILIDATPETLTFEDAALLPGRSLRHQRLGATINVGCRTANGNDLEVEICLDMSCPPAKFACAAATQ